MQYEESQRSAKTPTNPIIFVAPTVSATAILNHQSRFNTRILQLKSFKLFTLPSEHF